MNLDITKAQVGGLDQIEAYSIPLANPDSPTGKENTWQIKDWAESWGALINVDEYQNAMHMKALWHTGKGWEANATNKVILRNISGWGKDNFDDVILNLDLTSMACGDSLAHIIRDEKTKTLLNLKPLNTGNFQWVTNEDGIITEYRQLSAPNKDGVRTVVRTYKPEEIFHLSYNRLLDQPHGTSIYSKVKDIITADKETFKIMQKVIRQQAIPFLLFKYKTDDENKIDNIVRKIRTIREKYDDLHLPDDENILSVQPIEISPSNIIMLWRDDLRNKFYRAVGLPQIVPGGGGATTDSDARTIYLAFEQLVKQRQLYLENQIQSQLGIAVKFNAPTTMMELIGNDENKDGNNFALQQSQFNPASEQQ